jgi:pyruvate-ferredoxin/flavodoxin oxidoreductase
MAAYGAAQHGKREVRKELALIAIAHRGVYVHQSSQASAAHLVGGVLRGLQKRRPAVFNLYTPCPVEHGLADDWSMRAARLALESRAFPYLTFDPDAGPALSDALSLDGNPSLDDRWPSYTLRYTDAAGQAAELELPLTIADWAATEGRFKKHFSALARERWNEDAVPFHEYIDLSRDDREGKTPFIHTLDRDNHLARLSVSPEIVQLAEERLQFWSQLKELAGLTPTAAVRDRIVATAEAAFEEKLAGVRAEYEARLAALPQVLAKRMSEALLRGAGKAVAELVAAGPPAIPNVVPREQSERRDLPSSPNGKPPVQETLAAPTPSPALRGAATMTAATVTEEALAIDPYIDSARCTTCNECTNLNSKLFGYNANKQATIKNPDGGPFQHLVLAAERCPVGIIHPGTPRNPKEKDLAKWIKRAEPFS